MFLIFSVEGCCGRNRIVVGFTATITVGDNDHIADIDAPHKNVPNIKNPYRFPNTKTII
jgi:hypothetical protein